MPNVKTLLTVISAGSKVRRPMKTYEYNSLRHDALRSAGNDDAFFDRGSCGSDDRGAARPAKSERGGAFGVLIR